MSAISSYSFLPAARAADVFLYSLPSTLSTESLGGGGMGGKGGGGWRGAGERKGQHGGWAVVGEEADFPSICVIFCF